jgi:signal peptidase II
VWPIAVGSSKVDFGMRFLPKKVSVGPALAMLWVALFCIGCDQASKRVAAEVLKGTETLSFLGDIFRLTYAENRGAFLGLGGGWPEPVRWLVFTGAALAVVIASLGWVVAQLRSQRYNSLAVWAMVLIAAGGMGNLVDRIVREGRVIDFMNLGLGPVRTGIFNVADVQIMIGLGLLLVGRPKLEVAARAPS